MSRRAKKITAGARRKCPWGAYVYYSEDYFLSITQRLGKKTMYAWTLNSQIAIQPFSLWEFFNERTYKIIDNRIDVSGRLLYSVGQFPGATGRA